MSFKDIATYIQDLERHMSTSVIFKWTSPVDFDYFDRFIGWMQVTNVGSIMGTTADQQWHENLKDKQRHLTLLSFSRRNEEIYSSEWRGEKQKVVV